MRVIGGEFRSRRLKSLAGTSTRPTPDRLRESLFSILHPVLNGSVFVDAYAGTGAVGIEALSRGAKLAVFVERSPAALAVIRDNLKSLGIGPERARIIGGKVSAALEKAVAGAAIVFLDPPYEPAAEYESTLMKLGKLPDPPTIIVQHPPRLDLSANYGRLERYRVVRQGDNRLSFYAATTLG